MDCLTPPGLKSVLMMKFKPRPLLCHHHLVTYLENRSAVFHPAEPGGAEQVELEMLVSVSQVSVAQSYTVVRQLAALLHVLDSDIQVRALLGHSHLRYQHGLVY